MIPPQEADAVFADSLDLGDCEMKLRQRFPTSTPDERLQTIREAHRRVLDRYFGNKRRPKRRFTA